MAPAILGQWNRRNPGLFELSNLLNQRKVMRHWAKKESGPTDRQLSIYVASHYRALLTNEASLSSAMALNLINGDQRRFALDSLALHPAPTDNEIAEAETTVKKFLPRSDIIDVVGKPSFALMMLNWGLAIWVCLPALIAALAFRGGLVLLATGVTFVRRDGAPASRGRLFWRALVAWSPLLLAVRLSLFSMSEKNPGGPALALVGVAGLALLSVALPQRGLQDRLAGTWPVPR